MPDTILTVYIVDDELILLQRLERTLTIEGYAVRIFASPVAASEAIDKQPPHLIVTDVRMPEMTGIELMQRAKIRWPVTEVIVITGFSSLDAAVETTKKGAFYYLAKPFKLEQIKLIVSKAAEKVRLALENEHLQGLVARKQRRDDIIGESPLMQKVFTSIDKAAPVNCNVLIQGETGTGKELVAAALHRGSSRKDEPFVSFNCASFSEELMANELFGHEKGAFTGATHMKPGLLETGNGGTIFLDELGDMPLAMQTKLLRVIQQREFMRVGGVTPIKIDIRIVGATNRNLKMLMDSGEFRSDLFYRLNVVFIELPPLRERKEDIPLLLRHFIDKYNTVFEKQVTKTTTAFLDALMTYSFPGNVRELENIVERAIAFAGEPCLDAEDLPPDLNLLQFADSGSGEMHSLKDHENEYIRKIYRYTDSNQERTSELLGISRTTLWRRLKEMDLL